MNSFENLDTGLRKRAANMNYRCGSLAIVAIAIAGCFAVASVSAASSADPGGHTRKGVSAAEAKNWVKAIAEFTKAIEAQPKMRKTS